MQEALIAAAFLLVAALIGGFIKPGEDQLRPLYPQASSGEADAHTSQH